MAQTSHTPNLEAQRAAMKKLSFLIGEWSGEASAIRGPGPTVELTMTEAAAFKLDGLVLMIEGVGRTKSDTKPSLQALGLVTFDDAAETHHMRAYNDGRWLETEVKLLDDGKSLSWGFTFGDISTKTLLRINERGEWTEHAEYTVGARAPQKLMDLVVRRAPPKGASPFAVAMSVLRQGALVIATGIVAGLPFAFMAARMTGSLLWGVKAGQLSRHAYSERMALLSHPIVE